MRDRVNEVAPSFSGAACFKTRPGAHFRPGAVSRAYPLAPWSRPIVPAPAQALPQLKQHPVRALPLDLELQSVSRRRSLPLGPIARRLAEVAALVPREAA